ncbi:MAG TPA: zinc ribbon domain-containing protein [Clostridiales bacterium]|nr:zinc ribbon domain-containing protein [Clostridiales bacterium]HRT81554.1 zinc ribbon domain-containing protein [Oscillospiraceae bacterium]
MAGFFDSIVKGLSELAPQDDPSVKAYRAKNELGELDEKEKELFAALGKRVYEDGGQDKYPDLAVQLEAIAANRAAIQQRILEAEEERLAKEKMEAVEEDEDGRVRCPNCETYNPPTNKFCLGCGEKLDPVTYCVSCGANIAAGSLFCGECGARQNG